MIFTGQANILLEISGKRVSGIKLELNSTFCSVGMKKNRLKKVLVLTLSLVSMTRY